MLLFLTLHFGQPYCAGAFFDRRLPFLNAGWTFPLNPAIAASYYLLWGLLTFAAFQYCAASEAMVARESCMETTALEQYGHLAPLLVLSATIAVQMCGCPIALPHSLDISVWLDLDCS